MGLIIAAVSSLIIFLLIMGIVALFGSGKDKERKKIKQRLRTLTQQSAQEEEVDYLIRQSAMSEVPWFNRALERVRWAASLERMISQANLKGGVGRYLLTSAVLCIIGVYIAILFDTGLVGIVVLGWILGFIPIWYVKRKKAQRMQLFQKQLPEALDLMSRALKAGHTFSGGMRMVADEFDDPIGLEFGKTLDEINFGVDVDRALRNLLDRVDVTDLKFFVVSVNIQRETGGNLAEIITKIAHLVRERFVLFGKVRVLSAEGRVSAILLCSLPFVIGGIIYLLNSEYMSLLWTTELGKSMTTGAVVSMVIGIAFIRKMVRIKV